MALTDSQKNSLRHPFQWLFEPTPEKTPSNPDQENPDGSIPRRELSGLMFGLMGQNQLYGLAGGWFFHFMTNVLKIRPETVGTMMGIITAWDAVNDTIAGGIIDNYRFKNGQKLVPWVKYTSPLMAVFAFFMFVNWGYANTNQALLYSTIVYLLWDSVYSFQDSAIWGLTAIISPRSSEKARSVQWAEVGVTLGGLIPGLLGAFFSGDGLGPFNQQQIYLAFAVILCLGGGFISLFACRVRERIPNPPKTESVFKGIIDLRHNYILWLFILSDVLSNLSPRMSDVFLYQSYHDYHIGSWTLPAGLTVTIVGAVMGIPDMAMKFFANKIIDKFGGGRRLMIIAKIVSICVRIVCYFIRIDTLPRLILTRAVGIINSIPNSVNGVAMRSMIADSVDYVEWKTGKRTEGMTMAARNFQSKINGAIGNVVQGFTLAAIDYDADAIDEGREQSEMFQTWRWPTFQLGPVIGLVTSVIPLIALKLPDYDKIGKDLAERRAARKEAEEAETVEMK